LRHRNASDLDQRLAENIPRNNRVELFQRIACLAHKSATLIDIPKPGFFAYHKPPHKSLTEANQNPADLARQFEMPK